MSLPWWADLKEMCELMGIEQAALERAFSFRTVEARTDKVSTTLNVAQVTVSQFLPFFFSFVCVLSPSNSQS